MYATINRDEVLAEMANTLSKGDARSCVKISEHFLQEARKQNSASDSALALAYLGAANRMAGHHTFAAECFAEAKRLAIVTEQHTAMYMVLVQTGQLQLDISQYAEALETFRRALVIAQKAKEKDSQARALNGLGIACARMQDYGQAREFYEEALLLQRETGNQGGIANTYNCMGMLEIRIIEASSARGEQATVQVQKTVGIFEQALPMAVAAKRDRLVSQILGNIGRAYIFSHEYAKTIDYELRSIAMSHRLAAPGDEAESQANLAEAYIGLNDLESAYSSAKRSLDLSVELGSLDDQKRGHRLLAAVHEAKGEFPEGFKHLKLALSIESRAGRADALARLRQVALADKIRAARVETESWQQRATDLDTSNKVLSARAAELDRISQTDPLTGILNRRYLEIWQKSIAAQQGKTICAAFCDLDHFKDINDRFGHATGDLVLRQVATIMKNSSRDADLLIRYGGEEFLLLFPDTAADAAALTCERIRTTIESTRWIEIATDLAVTASFGLAASNMHVDVSELISQADGAVYRAKNSGRNRLVRA
jgi:diguanylate cyclase (GGDEF)-like protein